MWVLYIYIGHFKRRGYPEKYLIEALIKTCALSRESLLLALQKDEGEDNDDLFLITEYCPEFDGLKPMIQKSWDYTGKEYSSKMNVTCKFSN